MRVTAISTLVLTMLLASPVYAQQTGSITTAAAPNCAQQSNVMGVSRTVEIDTTGGPGFGFEHFKMYDFLQPNEVVLTFDDGPWPTTPIVLRALAEECVKAIFFSIGRNAVDYPDILKKVAAGGHTIGSHTWTHQ